MGNKLPKEQQVQKAENPRPPPPPTTTGKALNSGKASPVQNAKGMSGANGFYSILFLTAFVFSRR